MEDPRLPEIIERGIAAYRLAPQAIDLGAGGRIDTVGMVSPDAAGEIGETAFWNFKAGLTLRFFGALRRSPNAAVQAIASRHRDRLAVFDAVLRRQLAQAAVEHAAASNSAPRFCRARPTPRPSPGSCSDCSDIRLINRAHARNTRPVSALRRARERKAMPEIPTDAMAAAEFIVRHLYRPVEVADDGKFFAATETAELVGGDNWFWLDDNAKVLEFLSRPEVWRRFPEQTLEMLRFVRWMCQGPFMLRRISSPRLERIGEGEGLVTGAQHIHSLMRIRRDLPRGMVAVGVRFHDIRSADNLLLTGNVVSFAHRGRRYRSMSRTRSATSTSRGRATCCRCATRASCSSRSVRRSGGSAGSPTSTRLTPDRCCSASRRRSRSIPDADISDVEITIAHDQLSHGLNDVHYGTVAVAVPGAEPPA